MNKFSIPSAILAVALGGCSTGSLPRSASHAPLKIVQGCIGLIGTEAAQRTAMAARRASCVAGGTGGGGGDGSITVNDFSSLVNTRSDAPIDIAVNFDGGATIEVSQPNSTSLATVTLTYANYPDVITDHIDMSPKGGGIGGSIRDGVIGWLVGKALDWLISHDVHGVPNGIIVYSVPNSSAPNGGEWIAIPILILPGDSLPPGWIPASQQNWGNPNLPPMAPPMPANCGLGDMGPDCRGARLY